MRFMLILATLSTILLSTKSHAIDGQTKLPLTEVNGAPPAEDVDAILTNDQLRATSGSKSKFSLTSSVGYSGSTINKPLSVNRPNLSGTTGTTDAALISGAIATQYNWRPVHAFLAGAGVRWIAPLESKAPKNYEGSRVDADNPFVAYQYIYNWHGLESVMQLQAQYFTNSNLTKRGYSGTLVLSQDSSYKIGQSGLAAGFSFWSQVSNYTKKGPLGNPDDSFYMADVRDDQSDYGIGLEPVIEFEISDRLSLRSQTQLWAFEHVRSAGSPHKYQVNKLVETIGVGISVTRDIFLFPNVAFLPEDIRSDRTNMGLNADINLF